MNSRIFTIRGKTKVLLSHWCDSADQTNSGPVQRKGGRVPAGLLAALESSLLPRSRVTPVIGQFLRDSTSPLLPGSPFTPANWCLSCKLLRQLEPALPTCCQPPLNCNPAPAAAQTLPCHHNPHSFILMLPDCLYAGSLGGGRSVESGS